MGIFEIIAYVIFGILAIIWLFLGFLALLNKIYSLGISFICLIAIFGLILYLSPKAFLAILVGGIIVILVIAYTMTKIPEEDLRV